MLGEQLKMLEADLPARNLHPLAEPPLVWEVDNRTEYFSEWFSLTYRKPKFSLRGKQSLKLRYFVGGQGALPGAPKPEHKDLESASGMLTPNVSLVTHEG